ncbi:PHD zinc finger protein (macronuclear) [Tetrahymena thermophila SB210]|uniref:PHD zinc finger protein n=1 Tax=Tetrahymena thermophila (strain SB210) TaxID=312017 RepID=I7M2N2_TETTS|nr:PHD zinc finger protein [Tetrahymena thermophila SB210]EAS00864.1 PHD zinc finger protein [Tetrahymena thermophila SB210]|eukprot:XP_001021109.1 PHD zinc finger protein [Tetrahymena thermophila SB210]
MNSSSSLSSKKKSCEGQIILPFLPEWYCYLCRQNKVEKPIVKGYLGNKREKQPDKILNLHLTCTLFIPELHLYFSSYDGFEVFNVSKVQTEDYQCLICQDSGNPKKGYSIKCREETCCNKTHLACINKTRIYKQENEQKLLKCFTLCRQHARSNPQPYETTYDKLYTEIQNEWIVVYKQLEEQEKIRQFQEKSMLQQQQKGKGGIMKKQNAQSSNIMNSKLNQQVKIQSEISHKPRANSGGSNIHNTSDQLLENSQGNLLSENSGLGNISTINTTGGDNFQDSNQQNQHYESSQSNNNKKKRGRPSKKIDFISSFQQKNQYSVDGTSQSEEKGDIYDSTTKKVFTETREDKSYSREIFPFDSSAGAMNSKNDANLRPEGFSSPSNTEKKSTNEDINNIQKENEYQRNAYTMLFGFPAVKEESQSSQDKNMIVNQNKSATASQQDELKKKNILSEEETEKNQSQSCRRSQRQEIYLQNKKNEKQQVNLKSAPFRRGSSFDASSCFQNSSGILSQSIYDNPFTKILNSSHNTESQGKLDPIRSSRSASVPCNNSSNQKANEVIEIDEEEEQYLECGYPNYNDDKRQQNMEQWWFKIDSEYFTSPQNPSQIISEVLYELNVENDYLKQDVQQINQNAKSSHKNSKSEKQTQFYLFYPKQIKQEQIEHFCSTPVANLYLQQIQLLQKSKEEDNQSQSFGYQMNISDFEEIESEDHLEIFEESESILKKEKSKEIVQSSQKKEQQNGKKKQSAKKQKDDSVKTAKKNRNKQDQNRSQTFDQEALNKNLRDSTSCKENVEENMLIIDCNDDCQNNDNEEEEDQFENYTKNKADKEMNKQQQNNSQAYNPQISLTAKEGQDQLNPQQRVQSDQNMDIENDAQKDCFHQQNNKQLENIQPEIIEKKEEEIDLEISQNVSEEQQNKQNEVKIEELDSCIKESTLQDEESSIKKEEFSENQIKIEEIEKLPSQLPSQFRQKSSSIKYNQEDKQKYINYYQQEYVSEPLPIKIGKKISALFHSVNGDGYLVVYDVNENADIKRSYTRNNKSEYQLYGVSKDTDKLKEFIDAHKINTAPGIDENNRRRAVPTSDTTPQLMFSKIMHLDYDALQIAVKEQIDLNNNLINQQDKGEIDLMLLRNIFFEKQWCMNQKIFMDWQKSVNQLIQEDKDISCLKKQSTAIWDFLKLSQIQKNIIIGYSDKEEYNTEIYFMVSSEDDNEQEKHSYPTKRPINSSKQVKDINQQQSIVQKDEIKENESIQNSNQENVKEANENQDQPSSKNQQLESQKEDSQALTAQENQVPINQNSVDVIQVGVEENIQNNTEAVITEKYLSTLVQNQTLDQKQMEIENCSVSKESIAQSESRKCSENQESLLNEIFNVERNQVGMQGEQPENSQQLKDNKQKRKNSSSKMNVQPISKKSEDLSKTEESNKPKDQQNQQTSEQKSKLRARKPQNTMQQQTQKLSAYMRKKNAALLQGDASKQQTKASTIFETVRKGKANPNKRLKKNSQFKSQLETDCMICFSQKNTDNNPVVYCSDCQQSFHKICYGIYEVPEGKFFCDKCKMIRSLKHKERYQKDILIERFSCPLCVETDLPIKLIYLKNNHEAQHNFRQLDEEGLENESDELKQYIDQSISQLQIENKLNNHGELWMHPFCMFTFNLAKFQDDNIVLTSTDFPNSQANKDSIHSDSSISSEDIFSNPSCQICQKSHGITVKCKESECNEYFHPLCAFFQGLQSKVAEKAVEKQNQIISKKSKKNKQDQNLIELSEQGQLEFEINCKKHCTLLRKQVVADEQSKLEQEGNKTNLSLEIRQIQENLKQDIDFYLKQIFYRRFGVNYEKICTYFYYYEDFHEEVYLKNNLKIKFYNPHDNEYQSIQQIKSFLQFGPLPKNQLNNQLHWQNQNNTEEITNSKNQDEEEDIEEIDYGEEEEYDDDDVRNSYNDEEIDLEDKYYEDDQQKKAQTRKIGYKQNSGANKKGESGLKPKQTTYKKQLKQKDQKQNSLPADIDQSEQIQKQNQQDEKDQMKMEIEENLPLQTSLNNEQVKTQENQSNQKKQKVHEEENIFDQYELEDDFGSQDDYDYENNLQSSKSSQKESDSANKN